MIIEPRLYDYWYWIQRITTYLYIRRYNPGEKHEIQAMNKRKREKKKSWIEENSPAV